MKINLNKKIKIIISFFSLFIFMILSFSFLNYLNFEDDFINIIYSKNNYNYSFLNNYDIKKLNEKDFIKIVKLNYEYTKEKDCKYWSYLYYNYFKQKGYDVKYIYNLKIKHIFIVAYKDTGYYFLDNDNIEFYKISYLR